MVIKNTTRNTILTRDAKVAKTFLQKSIGLLGKEKPQALIIKTRWGIHTFGMKFTIAIIVLDKKNRVVTIKKNLKPNHFFFWNLLYSTIVELPQHTIQQSKTQRGDIIQIV